MPLLLVFAVSNLAILVVNVESGTGLVKVVDR